MMDVNVTLNEWNHLDKVARRKTAPLEPEVAAPFVDARARPATFTARPLFLTGS